MSRQPDGWDLVKALAIFGSVVGLLSWLAGEEKGGPFAAASFVSGLVCNVLEPPVCDSCEVRTRFEPSIGSYRCPDCGRWYIK